MKRITCTLIILLTVSGLAAQDLNRDWANFGRYAKDNKTAPRGADAVFIGNSITDGWAGIDPEFFAGNNYIGRGISGQVTSQMLARFRADVIDLEPKCVVILAGTNDIARNNGYISLENIYGNIVSMAQLAQANGIKVVICSVLPVSHYPWRPEIGDPAGKITELNGMLKDFAQENGFSYADYHSAMADEKGGLPSELAQDGVHPTKEGYEIMKSIVKPIIDLTIN